MFKVKKRKPKSEKPPELYNILENYTDRDPPGNVMVCAMAGPEDVQLHSKVLAESYEVPLEVMTELLGKGGLYTYPQTGLLVTRGLFACKFDPTGRQPKQTWVLDLQQYADVEQLVRSRGITMEEASEQVFYRTLPDDLKDRLAQKNLGLDYAKLDSAIAKNGDIQYIDFRKDWSSHFRRKCAMPDGTFLETGGILEFAELHGIEVAQAERLLSEGGTLEIDGGVIACQIINGQPTVARFNNRQYAKANDLAAKQGLHIMDALSEMALNDPVLSRALQREVDL